MASFADYRPRLMIWTLLSSIWLVIGSSIAMAHEVVPTIADLITSDGRVTLEMRINIEAQLSGIDLDTVEDTNTAENAADYDALRALPAEDVAARASELVASWSENGLIAVDGATISLGLGSVIVPEELDSEQPRISNLIVTGVLPAGAASLEVAWPQGAGDLVLRQQGVDAPFTGLVSGGTSSGPITIAGGDAANGWQTFVNYIPVGFDHILPKGLDHILFVLGLFFLSTRLRSLIWQVSAFTLAHTVTLALGALGIVNVPGSIVEPLIAASIVFVAVENVFSSGLKPWRPVVIFCFGLLHGLGFASVLGEFGLPEAQFISALIGFNIGVELGQLTVIALAFLAVGWFAAKPWYRSAIAVPASCVIAAVGAFWFVERVFL